MRAFATLAATLALALTGCGTPADEAATASEETATATDNAGKAASEAPQAAVAARPASYGQCVSCHAVEPGRHGVGPSLAGVFGARAGDVAGYAASPALNASGLTWDEATLDAWLAGPAKLVPGTRMVYPGQPDPAKRQELIAYLRTLK